MTAEGNRNAFTSRNPEDDEAAIRAAGSPEAVPDGQPYRGQAADVQAAQEPAEGPEASQPPSRTAPKAEWVDHAVSQGADPAEAESKTKAQLVEEHGA